MPAWTLLPPRARVTGSAGCVAAPVSGGGICLPLEEAGFEHGVEYVIGDTDEEDEVLRQELCARAVVSVDPSTGALQEEMWQTFWKIVSDCSRTSEASQ